MIRIWGVNRQVIYLFNIIESGKYIILFGKLNLGFGRLEKGKGGGKIKLFKKFCFKYYIFVGQVVGLEYM